MRCEAVSQPQTLQVVGPEHPAWSQALGRLPLEQQDVFYTPEYAVLCARFVYPGAEARCAILETERALMVYPFLQRDLAALTGRQDLTGGCRDRIGCYGRGGLLADQATAEELEQFHRALEAYGREERIICGFDRYHPVVQNHRWADARTALRDIGGFVVVDLRRPIGDIERSYKHALRKHIAQAERAHVEVFSEETTEHLEEFLVVYRSTLQRRRARAFYDFDPAFYQALTAQLPGRYRFFYARVGGRIVSCELVLRQGAYCHSFLGGTLEEALAACPNHLLKRDLIREAHAWGCRYYLLGGGQRPYDGIWNYKAYFAVDGSVPSMVGGTIVDEAAYRGLQERWRQAGLAVDTERFQFYDLA